MLLGNFFTSIQCKVLRFQVVIPKTLTLLHLKIHSNRFLRVELIVGGIFRDSMHVSRGGWLGQTYALAKFDDSFDGKKTVIRRSKEERKGMVEKYIKRYQKLNNGDFPSLNLTRKEVGGSFYTVREIVREIIQENRVLGPPKPKTPPGDENMENVDSFLENYPLGYISVDHDVHQKDELVADETQKHQILDDLEVTGVVHHVDEKLSVTELADGDLKEKDIENSEAATGNNDHLVCNDDNGSTDVKLEEPLLAEEKAVVNGAISQNLDSKTSGSVQQQTVGEKRANFNNSSDQNWGNSQNRSPNATINRINLESWKATSKKSNGREVHPLVKFIRSSIAAFVKFWSE